MDSGNSGSLQSSSGGGAGDDDFDAACGGGSVDSSSTTSPLAALLRHSGFGGGGGASPLIYGLQDLGAPPLSSHWCSTTTATALALPPPTAGASPPPAPCHGAGLASSGSAPAAAAASQQQPSSAPPLRGSTSRKRARASRRAPTTVLTTDTSNFRAMVQEFTGIPAPPFASAASSPAARSRLDSLLFPSRSAAAAASLPQYLLRPFAHKLPHAYPPPASTSSPAPATAAVATPAGASTAAMVSGDGYQHHLTTSAPSALLGMQDHGGGVGGYLSFQSALAVQLDGGGVAPPPDPADFLGLTHGVVSSEGNLHQRNGGRSGHGGDELSGLVGGCKRTYSTAPPLLQRNGPGAAAGASMATKTTAPRAPVTAAMMRTQAADSWVCSTSE
ncbi:unnamed protein product [Urochloa humidicola]